MSSLQTAITNAGSGDVIIIDSGTYFSENILIKQKADLLIRSAEGPANTIIQANNSSINVITIESCNNITIQGLNITGAGIDKSGVYVYGSLNCKVKDNILHDDALGVYLRGSNNAVVQNNIFTKNLLTGLGRAISIQQSNYAIISSNQASNQKYGIYISNSITNTVSGNNIAQSTSDSIVVENSDNNIIENNTASSSSRHGIYLTDSSNNSLRDNAVSNSYGGNGIYLLWSPQNTVSDNEVDLGSVHDIMLDNSSNNIVNNNVISSSPYGIAVRYSNNNILTGNNAYNNSLGFYLTLTSSNNTLSSNKANSNRGSGISLYRVSGNTVENNEAKSNTNYGIILDNSSNNKVSNNIASGNSRGIYVTSSSRGNTLSDNTLNSNTGHGIILENAGASNNLTSNNASSNGVYGIYLMASNSTSLLNNVASGNSKGIYIVSSSGNTVSNNTVFSNKADADNSNGIMLSLSSGNKVIRNMAYDNPYGISLNSSRNNNISSNYVVSNSKAGMFLCARSTDNLIYNNYFNNLYNTDNNNTGCTWNITKTSGRNIAGGNNIGGNYWADPLFNDDHSQIYANNDTDGDGIIDIVYNKDDVIDYLPLLEVHLVFPVANFNTSATSGYAPLSVTFTDLSQNAVSRSWDVNGDGVEDSKEASFVYEYASVGTYTAKLTAINENGTSEKTTDITVLQKNESKVLPVANFSTNVTSGYVPLSVAFTDLSQNAVSRSWDVNGDGVEDSNASSFVYEYASAGTYTAKLTAINANGTNEKTAVINVLSGLPVADFSTSVTGGYAPLSVTFTDLSQNAISRTWDVNGDGVEDSNASSFVYEYASAGTYTAKLTASNANGTNSKTTTITVDRKSSGGSSGGGGGGGSPESAKNVEVKELSQVFITNGKPIKFDFTKNATCVVYVGFDAKKTVGKTTTIAEQLKNKSTLTSNLTEGEVYRYFNVWVGNSGFASSSNIENPVICFKVEKSWLQDKNIDQDSIALNRYSNKTWEQLPVSLLKEDNKYLYFTADVPGYSFFAITGKLNTSPEEDVTEIEPEDEPDNSADNEGDTGSESDPESDEGRNTSMPGFEMVCGIISLSVAFLYKRK